MLDYSIFNNLYGIDYLSVDKAKSQYVMDELKKRQERLAAKEEAIRNLNYEKDLIISDICGVIAQDLPLSGHYVFRGLSAGTLLEKAWSYCNYKDKVGYYEKEEAKDEDKGAYQFACLTIERNILLDNKEFKFNNRIVDYCYGLFYEFEYIIRGHKIWICIPNYEAANSKNYIELLQGHIVRYQESENVIGILTSNIDYKELAKDLIAWVNKTWPKRGRKKKEENE